MDMAKQLAVQVESVAVTAVWSALATFVLVKALAPVTGLRVNAEEENEGLDLVTYGESAYEHT